MALSYNPKAVEPNLRGKIAGLRGEMQEIQEKHREEFLKRGYPPPLPQYTYKQIREGLEKGEGAHMGHYVYEMLFDIYPGMEDDLMVGAWDTHGHIFPDYVPRCQNIIDFAIEASKIKMGGIVCKDHFFTNVQGAWGAQFIVDEMVRKGELEYACKVYGTHILAWSMDPDQIHLIRKYPNLGGVFFNTMTGGGGAKETTMRALIHQAGHRIDIINDNGKLTPEAKEIVDLCAEYKIPIFTGHRVYAENLAICKEGAKVGAHILITHAESMAGTFEQSKELGEMGAQLEINAAHGMPNPIMPGTDPNYMQELITAVGPQYCHINTDYGQPITFDPIEGYRIFLRFLLHWGIKREDIRTMVHVNPEKLLYLRD